MTSSCSYFLECVVCQKVWDEHETCTNCRVCGGALDVRMNLESVKKRQNLFTLRRTPLSAAKYLDWYPLNDHSQVISLQEGNTPLHHAKKIGKHYGLPHLHVKDEGQNPTGVFKDRGSLVEITKAKELGAKAVCVASTGNMAASVAAYASQADLPCYILVPEGTPIGKLSQALSYGGKLIQIRGQYADCVELAQKLSERNGYYLAGDYAFREEGAKSTAFEIIEQLHWNVPDVVIIPVGCGTNLSGIWKGFMEFHDLGLIDSLPKIIGVQPTGCDTICQAFQNGDERHTFVKKPNTIASAVGIGVPQDDVKCLRAIRLSKGTTAVASDEDILNAQQFLAEKESLFTEPSGAIPIAVLPHLLEKNILSPLQTIVCIATGTGLKDPKAVLAKFSEPISLEKDVQQIEHFLKTGSPSISSNQEKQESLLFTALPTLPELKETIIQKLTYTPEDKVLTNIHHEITALLQRGKQIRRADLLRILEESIENTLLPKGAIEIVDFSLTSSYSASPRARIEILFQGQASAGEATGVGPVDALIHALKDAVSPHTDFWPLLHDFHVDVASSREDALVKVHMDMQDGEGTRVQANSASPDIVIASLHAFIKGFHLLHPS